MRIALYGRSFGDALIPEVQRFFNELEAHNVEVLVFEPFLNYCSERIEIPQGYTPFNRNQNIIKDLDFLFSLGGDGTMLDAVTLIGESGVPMLGINTGRLGFLASTARDHMVDAVKAVISQQFALDSRTLLSVSTPTNAFGETNFALNEFTVLKRDTSSMITINAYLNDEYLNSYWADGLIIATPTGSTAYSLSCGGPIISPESSNWVITPIAPHNLNVRPVVVTDDHEITLKVESRSEQFLVALDSRSISMATGTELVIKKARFKINLIQLENESFLSTLRSKLMWGLDKRN